MGVPLGFPFKPRKRDTNFKKHTPICVLYAAEGYVQWPDCLTGTRTVIKLMWMPTVASKFAVGVAMGRNLAVHSEIFKR